MRAARTVTRGGRGWLRSYIARGRVAAAELASGLCEAAIAGTGELHAKVYDRQPGSPQHEPSLRVLA